MSLHSSPSQHRAAYIEPVSNEANVGPLMSRASTLEPEPLNELQNNITHVSLAFVGSRTGWQRKFAAGEDGDRNPAGTLSQTRSPFSTAGFGRQTLAVTRHQFGWQHPNPSPAQLHGHCLTGLPYDSLELHTLVIHRAHNIWQTNSLRRAGSCTLQCMSHCARCCTSGVLALGSVRFARVTA